MKVIVTIIYTRDPPSQNVAPGRGATPESKARAAEDEGGHLRHNASNADGHRDARARANGVRANGGEPGVSSTFEAL